MGAHVDPNELARAYVQTRKALDTLYRAYVAILPGVSKISVPDYGLLNEAACLAREVTLTAPIVTENDLQS